MQAFKRHPTLLNFTQLWFIFEHLMYKNKYSDKGDVPSSGRVLFFGQIFWLT